MGVDHDTVDIAGAGVRLRADRWGPQSPAEAARGIVLLLHGGGQTRHSWRSTGARLGRRGWLAYAVDLRGHGDSEWAADGDYGISAIAEDVRRMVAHARHRDPGLGVALVGASLGGKAGLIALGEHPDLAQALVLVDIAVRVEASGGRRVRDFMRSAPAGFASLEEAAEVISAYNPHRPRPKDPAGLKKNLRLRDGRWHWHWDPRMMAPAGAEDDSDAPVSAAVYDRSKAAARRLSCPVLLVRGMQSDVISDAGVAEMRELIPHIQVVDVRGAGHMVAGDDNDIFTANLLGYLEGALSRTEAPS